MGTTHSLHSLIPGYHRSHSFSTTSNVQYLIPTVFLIPTPTITIKMRSFAVVAGFAAVALAAPQYEAAYPAASSAAEYPSYPVESSSAPAYEAASSAPAYEAASSAPSYPAETSSAAYEASKPAHEASSSAPAYEASKPAETHPAYTTTEVVHATSYVCPEPTVITHGPSTYTISTSTTLDIPEYTATYVHTPEPEMPSKPSMTETPSVPEATESHPAPAESAPAETHPAYSAVPPVPYPSANGTVPAGPAGTGYATGTGAMPSATKPSTPEFTGAAGKATVGFFAIAGALAAFL